MKFFFDHNEPTLIYNGEKQDLFHFKISQKNGHVIIKFKISELKIALEKICS